MGSSSGELFRVTTFGESHGGGVGVVVDGCPPRLDLPVEVIQADLDRRRPGQSPTRHPTGRGRSGRDPLRDRRRRHPGHPHRDARPQRRSAIRRLRPPPRRLPAVPRRLHLRREVRRPCGGGRRPGLGARDDRAGRRRRRRRRLLAALAGIEVLGWVASVHGIDAKVDASAVSLSAVEATATRCPDPDAASAIEAAIEQARRDGDSLGGIVECVARGVPAGAGRADVRQARGRSGQGA